MKESQAWAKLRRKLQELPETFVTRVENSASPGFPDLFITHKGKLYLFEMKVTKTEATTIKLRPSQEAWLRLFSRAGGTANILVFCESNNTCYSCVPTAFPNKLKNMTENEKKLIINIENLFIP